MPAGAEVTLLDLNPHSLASPGARIASLRPRTVRGNVLDPLPDGLGPFDSVGANHLFHCVPGTWADKGVAFHHLARVLAPGGVLFGGTVLGRGVEHNMIGRKLMSVYNDKGVFHNTDDDIDGLEHALGRHFSEVTVDVVGTVALFRASR